MSGREELFYCVFVAVEFGWAFPAVLRLTFWAKNENLKSTAESAGNGLGMKQSKIESISEIVRRFHAEKV